MYVKLFSQILHSSIADNRRLRHFFTDMLLCADVKGYVMMTPAALARAIGCGVDEVEWGLAALMTPDPQSKTPDHQGRRIEAVDGSGYGWRILNYEAYRAMKDGDQMREATRIRVQRHRAKHAAPDPVTSCNASNANTEAEAEAEAEGIPPSPQRGRRAAGLVEGKNSGNIPTTDQAKRFAGMMRRKLTTPWMPNEIKSYQKIGIIPEEDMQALEAYYAAEIPDEDNRRRTGMLALLNNVSIEIDRARKFTLPKPHAAKARPGSTIGGANAPGRTPKPDFARVDKEVVV